MNQAQRTRNALVLAALGIMISIGVRYSEIVSHAATDFVDFAALHGSQLIQEVPDTRLNSWILAWDLHAAATSTLSVFDSNAFHPAKNTLTGSEHLFGVALQLVPLRFFTDNAITLHQCALLLSTVLLAAFSGFALWILTRSPFASFAGGFAVVCMPWRVTELSHLQLSSAQFMPLVWVLVLCGLRRTLSRRECVILGVAVGLQTLSSFYLAYFLTFSCLVLVLVASWMLRPTWSALVRLAIPVDPAYALFVASALPYLERQEPVAAPRRDLP